MDNSTALYQKERIGLSLPELDLSQLPARISLSRGDTGRAIFLQPKITQVSVGKRP